MAGPSRRVDANTLHPGSPGHWIGTRAVTLLARQAHSEHRAGTYQDQHNGGTADDTEYHLSRGTIARPHHQAAQAQGYQPDSETVRQQYPRDTAAVTLVQTFENLDRTVNTDADHGRISGKTVLGLNAGAGIAADQYPPGGPWISMIAATSRASLRGALDVQLQVL